jgi:hypothetical protein
MAAAALAKFRVKVFASPLDLKAYVVADNSDVSTIVNIIHDSSGSYFLFYMIA